MPKAIFTTCKVVFEGCSLAGAMFNSCSFSWNCDVTFRKSVLIGCSFSSSSFESSKISFDQNWFEKLRLEKYSEYYKKRSEKRKSYSIRQDILTDHVLIGNK